MKDRLPYILLRRGLKAHGYNQEDVAELLERSRQYVSDRMTAKAEWPTGEGYKLLQAIGEEPSEFWRYFPVDPYEVIEKQTTPKRVFRLVEVPDEAHAL